MAMLNSQRIYDLYGRRNGFSLRNAALSASTWGLHASRCYARNYSQSCCPLQPKSKRFQSRIYQTFDRSFDSVTTHGSNMLWLSSSLCLTCQCSPLLGRSSWFQCNLFSTRFQDIPSTVTDVTELGSKIDQLGFIGFTLAPHCPICQQRLPVPSSSILFHPWFLKLSMALAA